jgi:hypothetical protein
MAAGFDFVSVVKEFVGKIISFRKTIPELDSFTLEINLQSSRIVDWEYL